MPFEQSFRMAYSRTHYGTGYYIYQQFVPGVRLSQPLRPGTATTPPAQDVLELDRPRRQRPRAPRRTRRKARAAGHQVERRCADAAAGTDAARCELCADGPAMLRALEFSASRATGGRLRPGAAARHLGRPAARLHRRAVALFFGAGTLYNRDEREYLVKAFPVNIRFDADRVHLACYFPMPFFQSAKIELLGNGVSDMPDVALERPLRSRSATRPARSATSTPPTATIRTPEPGQDLVLLDTRRTEGGGDWSGQLRRHLVHLLRTAPTSRRWKATRASSSTTARRRRRRAPAPRSGAAAATTGAART